jgi:hypothetical protein
MGEEAIVTTIAVVAVLAAATAWRCSSKIAAAASTSRNQALGIAAPVPATDFRLLPGFGNEEAAQGDASAPRLHPGPMSSRSLVRATS